MPNKKNPFKYPLRSRKDMIEYIVYKSRAGNFCYQNKTFYPLAWNVKSHDVPMDWESILKAMQENQSFNPTQIAAMKEKYVAEYGETKWDTTPEQDTNRSSLWDIGAESARWGLTDGDAYRTLWDGTELDVTWTFSGRSGGYASVEKYEGYDFSNMGSDQRFEEWLEEREDYYDEKSPYRRDFKFIRTLYKFVVEMDALLTSKAADESILYGIADFLVHNTYRKLLEEYDDSKVLLHATV